MQRLFYYFFLVILLILYPVSIFSQDDPTLEKNDFRCGVYKNEIGYTVVLRLDGTFFSNDPRKMWGGNYEIINDIIILGKLLQNLWIYKSAKEIGFGLHT